MVLIELFKSIGEILCFIIIFTFENIITEMTQKNQTCSKIFILYSSNGMSLIHFLNCTFQIYLKITFSVKNTKKHYHCQEEPKLE